MLAAVLILILVSSLVHGSAIYQPLARADRDETLTVTRTRVKIVTITPSAGAGEHHGDKHHHDEKHHHDKHQANQAHHDSHHDKQGSKQSKQSKRESNQESNQESRQESKREEHVYPPKRPPPVLYERHDSIYRHESQAHRDKGKPGKKTPQKDVAIGKGGGRSGDKKSKPGPGNPKLTNKQQQSGPSHPIYEIVYSPYNDDQSCKKTDRVMQDLSLIKSKGIQSIRVYSTDCDSLDTVVPAARQLGMTVSQGLWFGNKGVSALDPQVQDVLDFTKRSGWQGISSVIIGNEGVLAGFATPAELLDKARSIKGQFQQAGYKGVFMTAEPPGVYIDHPEMCKVGGVFDQVGINVHPYFNPGASADTSGSFVQGQIAVTQQHCPGMTVYITETGYPSKGSSNGANVPTQDNQRTSIYQIVEVLNGHGTFLSTFNDYWKQPGPNGIEQFFGIIQLL